MSLECQECGGETETRKRQLSEGEYTHVIECTECDWAIETESNLVAEERRERNADTSNYLPERGLGRTDEN